MGAGAGRWGEGGAGSESVEGFLGVVWGSTLRVGGSLGYYFLSVPFWK